MIAKLKALKATFTKRAGSVSRTVVRDRLDTFSESFEGRSPLDLHTDEALRRRKVFAHAFYNLLFSLLLTLGISHANRQSVQLWALRAGDIADRDIVAPVSAEIQPKELDRLRLEEVAKNVAPVFDYDDTLLDTWIHRWEQTFQSLRREYYAPNAKYASRLPRGNNELVVFVGGKILEYTRQQLSAEDILFLHQNRFSQTLQDAFAQTAGNLRGRLIAPSNLFPLYYNTGIELRLINQSMRATLIHDISRIWSVEQTREYLEHLPASLRSRVVEGNQNVVSLVSRLLIPNLELNQGLTQKRTSKALQGAKKNTLNYKRGDTIIRRGERITEDQIEIMQNLRTLVSPVSSLLRFSLLWLFLFVFLQVLFRLNITNSAFWNLTFKDALVFAMITLITVALARQAIPFLRNFFGPLNGGYGVEYLVPISAGGIIIHLMMGKEAGLTFAVLNSVVVGYFLEQNFFFTVYAFIMTTSGIQSIRSCKQRTDLYKSGAWSGLIGAILVIAFSLTQYLGSRSINWIAIGLAVSLAFCSGMLAAVITSSFIPVFEALFGYTTSLKLLELSNFNHPLLHNLMMKAPGTYHHSVIVGSLAEIAADQIKANSLLARVSAYYHDIGKMNKPLYFIENQTPNHNAHDHLQPSMSAKILFSHVKDGVKLGRDHNLGHKIISIIEQHHGTTLVSYFFNKAKKVEKPELDPVEETEFRYPGPRPQSREAAIVMLADACEAATRSINEPTAAKIQAMVHNIINRRFLEEQFNECDLTLSDLRVIEECFTRTLVSLYHHRIEYPGQKKPHSRSHATALPPMGRKTQGSPR